jgi:hypothetical protein
MVFSGTEAAGPVRAVMGGASLTHPTVAREAWVEEAART